MYHWDISHWDKHINDDYNCILPCPNTYVSLMSPKSSFLWVLCLPFPVMDCLWHCFTLIISTIHCLVVSTPLKNRKVTWDYEIPNWMEIHQKCSKRPTKLTTGGPHIIWMFHTTPCHGKALRHRGALSQQLRRAVQGGDKGAPSLARRGLAVGARNWWF